MRRKKTARVMRAMAPRCPDLSPCDGGPLWGAEAHCSGPLSWRDAGNAQPVYDTVSRGDVYS